MSAAAPTPTQQTLRHLRRLCASESLATTPSRIRHSRIASHSLRPLPQPPLPQPRNQPPSHRAFSTAPRRAQEPPAATSSASTNSNSSTPDITNYYTLFPSTLPQGPPPTGRFNIPVSSLKREFLRLQSQHHPDKSSNSSPTTAQSAGLSSLLNTAYKTLSDPLLRARYLLQHNYNVDITHEDNATHSALTDQATLMEVMEAQEAIEAAHSHEEIEALKNENAKRIAQAEQELGEAFEKEDVENAKIECVRLNYWRSLQSALHEWEPGREVRLTH